MDKTSYQNQGRIPPQALIRLFQKLIRETEIVLDSSKVAMEEVYSLTQSHRPGSRRLKGHQVDLIILEVEEKGFQYPHPHHSQDLTINKR